MAIKKDSLVGARVTSEQSTGFFAFEDGVMSGLLNPVTGAPDLAYLTPLTYSSGAYDVWEDGDAIDGFIYTALGQATDATDQVIVAIAKRGRVHAPSVALPTTNGQTLAALETALKSSLLRQKGIIVSELDGVA